MVYAHVGVGTARGRRAKNHDPPIRNGHFRCRLLASMPRLWPLASDPNLLLRGPSHEPESRGDARGQSPKKMRQSLTESLLLLVPLALQGASLASSLCSEPFYCAVLNPNGGRAPWGPPGHWCIEKRAPSSSKTAVVDEVGIGAPCRLYEELNDHCKRQPGQEPGKGKSHRP